MTIRPFAAFAVALVFGVPAPAFAVATLDHLVFSDTGGVLTPSTPIVTNPVPVGTRRSINVANTFRDPSGRIFTIQTARAGVNPTVFGDDSVLDQVGLTDALITYVNKGNATAAPVDLSIAYGFGFSPVTLTSQTYGIQITGAYKRGFGLATNDSVSVSSFAKFFNSTAQSAENQIDVTKSFTVVTSNTFGPATPPSGTEIISCSLTLPGAVCGSDVMQTLAVIHFAQLGDSLKIPNSFLAVRGGDGTAVQDFMNAAAAADAIALGVPEPSTLVFLLGSGLAGLGLSRLKHVRRLAGQDQHD